MIERPQADLLIRGARLLTLAPFRMEQPRVGSAAGDVGAVDDGWVAARDGAGIERGHHDDGERRQQEDVDRGDERPIEGAHASPRMSRDVALT